MRILVSNDDGVHAPGIEILAKRLKEIADIVVVAPDRDLSGASSSLSLKRPLRVKKLPNGFYSVEGTPTDCVHLAVTGYFDSTPDMVISGINDGANLGDDVLYSGTVGAAAEGRFEGFPALAISLCSKGNNHYETAAFAAKTIAGKLQTKKFAPQTVLNVNVPDIPIKDIRGYQITRLGTRHRAEPLIKEHDPRGREIYWIGPPGPEQDDGVGTDFHAINNNYVSITPLQMDLTNYRLMDDLSEWIADIV